MILAGALRKTITNSDVEDYAMGQINERRLFTASCIALVLTAMTFAIRARLETVFGPAGVGLTLEQIGCMPSAPMEQN